MNRVTVKAVLTAALFLGQSGNVAAQSLNVYNWKNYIDPDLVEDFTKDTGINVQLSEFTTTGELEQALYEKTGYDIVVPSHFQLPALIAENKIEPLDLSRLPNHSQIDTSLLAALAAFNGADKYAVPYLWAAIGIAYNPQSVKQQLRRKAPQSWSLLFYDDYLERLSSCGVSWLDASKETFSLKANFVGGKLDYTSERRLEKYASEMRQSARYVQEINNEGYINGLATGELCVSMAWAGHALAAKTVREAVTFMLPEEGGLLTIDSWVIVKDSTEKEAAYRFIDYMLTKQSGRRNATATSFFSHLPPSSASDQGIGLNPIDILGANYRHKLYFVENLEPSRTRLIEAHWQTINSNLQPSRR